MSISYNATADPIVNDWKDIVSMTRRETDTIVGLIRRRVVENLLRSANGEFVSAVMHGQGYSYCAPQINEVLDLIDAEVARLRAMVTA